MPSESYDFFAPLGEFGQPRKHYHQMRRLHTMLLTWGSFLANTTQSLPAVMPASVSDNTTLRWAVRTQEIDGLTRGFLFCNDYQRLQPLIDKQGIRFHVVTPQGVISVPSIKSGAMTVRHGTWFVWPLNIMLNPQISISWATAQLVSRIGNGTHAVLFLVQTEGVAAEIGLTLGSDATVKPIGKTHSSVEGASIVLREIEAGAGAFAVIYFDGTEISLVLLPVDAADRVWTAELAGQTRLMMTEDESSDEAQGSRAMLLTESVNPEKLFFRTSRKSGTIWVFPPLSAGLALKGSKLESSSNGVFAAYHVQDSGIPYLETPEAVLVKAADTPRAIPSNGKAIEPTMEDWDAAAQYTIKLAWPKQGLEGAEAILAVDYDGDAARIYFKDRLLTDNWYSGYRGDGAMQVGLTQLNEENPGLLDDGAELRLFVLPMKKQTLMGPAPQGQGLVFLQSKYWPNFGNESYVGRVNALRWLVVACPELDAGAQGQ